MLASLTNIVRIPELRRKLAATFGLLVAYRLGFHVFLPGVDTVRGQDRRDRVRPTLGVACTESEPPRGDRAPDALAEARMPGRDRGHPILRDHVERLPEAVEVRERRGVGFLN